MRLIAALSPAGVLFVLYAALRAAFTTSTLLWPCVAIGVALTLLAASGAWFTAAWSLPCAVRYAMWLSVALAAMVWAWQRIAFLTLVPDQVLTYGYFLTPPGLRPRLLILEAPLWIAALGFGVALVISCVLSWRNGHRALLLTVVSWWVVAFLTVATPSLYLWGQADAGIFI
jgi:hypothetical protein